MLVGVPVAVVAHERAAELAEPVGRGFLERASYGVSLVGSEADRVQLALDSLRELFGCSERGRRSLDEQGCDERRA